MNKRIVIAIVFLLSLNLRAFSQGVKKTGPAAQITFKQVMHNYGKVFRGSDGTFAFTFVNTGNGPLLLSRPRSSCGCTVPSWPKEPILPGDSAKINVTYNTYILGAFNKTVTVYSNASKAVVLRIRGRVIPRPKPLLPLKDQGDSPVSKRK